MAGFFSAADKSGFASLLDQVAETFAEAIYWISERQILTLSTDGNFNYAYGNTQNNVTKTTQISSGVISGRIYYADTMAANLKQYPQPEIPLAPARTTTRIKVNSEGYTLIKNAKQIRLPDGQVYELQSAARPIGPFGVKYIACELKEVK